MTDSKKNKTSVNTNASTKAKVTDAGAKAIPKKKLTTKTTTKVHSDTKSQKTKGATKSKATNKLNSSVKPKTSLNGVPDLNKNKGYPVHPDRIWPD
ncbi:hypothetical protein [uncultured Cocleimonas sp.]|uniref:hypothetical protein n=1 Tax=uncultured Cocleimonas sp. TaxID=1051587 RepID=UPI0026031FD6|nr:hypothetical protein [uncultured Cocleimonas sp.]